MTRTLPAAQPTQPNQPTQPSQSSDPTRTSQPAKTSQTSQRPRTPRPARSALLLAVLLTVVTGCSAAGVTPTAAPTGLLTEPAHAEIADPNVYAVTEDPQPQLPSTVASFDGEQVTVTDVDRIVAVDLYGTLTEIVYSLGLGDNVVGRDGSAGFPQAADVPVVTQGGHDLSAEAILALDPSVILTDTSIGPAAVQQQLRDAGIPVVFFDPGRSLSRVPAQIRAVAAALGLPGPGDDLVTQVDEQLKAAKDRLPEGVSAPRVAFLYLRGSAGVYLMGGPGSGADSLIEAVGGIDVGKEIGLTTSFTPITSERLIEAAPDVILVMTDGLKSLRGVDGLLKLPGLAQTPAGTARRIIDMPDTQMLSFGPRSGATVQALAAALYPAP